MVAMHSAGKGGNRYCQMLDEINGLWRRCLPSDDWIELFCLHFALAQSDWRLRSEVILSGCVCVTVTRREMWQHWIRLHHANKQETIASSLGLHSISAFDDCCCCCCCCQRCTIAQMTADIHSLWISRLRIFWQFAHWLMSRTHFPVDIGIYILAIGIAFRCACVCVCADIRVSTRNHLQYGSVWSSMISGALDFCLLERWRLFLSLSSLKIRKRKR